MEAMKNWLIRTKSFLTEKQNYRDTGDLPNFCIYDKLVNLPSTISLRVRSQSNLLINVYHTPSRCVFHEFG